MEKDENHLARFSIVWLRNRLEMLKTELQQCENCMNEEYDYNILSLLTKEKNEIQSDINNINKEMHERYYRSYNQNQIILTKIAESESTEMLEYIKYCADCGFKGHTVHFLSIVNDELQKRDIEQMASKFTKLISITSLHE